VEIKDYLKVLGKRAWLLVMIPAVAGVVAGLIAVQQPQAYRTTATLQLPRQGDNAAAPAQVAQQVADFQAAADNPTVQNKVSADTGVPVKKIKNLNIAQVGVSSQLTLGMKTKSKDPSDAKAVITGVATQALDYLQAPETADAQANVDDATKRANDAQAAITKANAALTLLYNSVGTSTPEADLAQAKNLRSDLTSRLATAQSSGETSGAAILQQYINQQNGLIIKLSLVVPQVQAQQAIIATATKDQQTAQDDRQTAVKAVNAIRSTPDLIFSAEGSEVIRKTRVVKTAAAAVVAGFPIAVGIVLLLDWLQRRRQAKALARAGAGGAAVAMATAPEPEPDVIVPSESTPAVVVGNRQSPRSTAPASNGVGRPRPIGEPALLIGGAGAAARSAQSGDPESGRADVDDLAAAAPVDDVQGAVVDHGAVDELDELDDRDLDGDVRPAADELDGDALDLDADEDLDEADDVRLSIDDDLELDDDEPTAGASDRATELDELDDDEVSDEDLLEADEYDEGDALNASENGYGRQPARVPDAEEAFDQDDEGPSAGH